MVRINKFFALSLVSLLACLVTGCSSATYVKGPIIKSHAVSSEPIPPVKVEITYAFQLKDRGWSFEEYRIEKEDVLAISVWGIKDLDKSVVVRPDGKISFPLIGDIQSEGESIPTMRKNITEQLSRYIKNPRVSVIIDRFGGKRVVLIDETGGGKVIRFTAPIPILEVLAMGPGYNYDANLKKIFIIREPKESGGKVQLIVCNAQEVLRHGDIRENVYVKSGDTIFLARGMLASVANFVKQVNRITNLKYNYTWQGKAMEAVVDTNFDQSQDTKTISDPY